MRPCFLLAPAVTAVLLGGCYYESPVPLGEPDPALVDDSLTGVWVAVDPASQDTMTLRVLPFSDRELYVEVEWVDSTSTSPFGVGPTVERVRLRGFETELDGVRFMNLQLIEEEERPYWLARFTLLPGDTLTVRPMADKAVEPPPSSSAALRAFLRDNLENPAIYDSVATFVRRR